MLKKLNKRAVAAVLRNDKTHPEVRQLLALRAEGVASTSKAASILAAIDDDDRVRDTFIYHGATTGRWTGKGAQPQNLKKATLDDLSAAREALLSGDMDRIQAICGSILTVASDAIRLMIDAPPGKELIGGDFSSIESCVLAGLTDQIDKVDQYRRYFETRDDDIEPYCITAGKILGRKVTASDKAGRKTGKTADLACGYGGWLDAWRNFADDDKRDDEAIKTDILAWRAAHPQTVKFWYALERAMIKAVRSPGKRFTCGRLAAVVENDILWMVLPSGRKLSYPEPELVEHRFKEDQSAIQFKKYEKKQWRDKQAWHGTFIQNAVQAIARDLLAAAMLRLEAAGYPVIMHVHDEIIAEVDEDFGSVEEFVAIMTALPNWARGWVPVDAKGWRRQRYAESTVAPAGPPEIAAPPFDMPPTKPKKVKPVPNTAPPEAVTAESVTPPPRPNGHDAHASAKPNGFAGYHSAMHEEPRSGAANPDRRHIYMDADGKPHTRHDIYRLGDGKKAGPIYHRSNGHWIKGRPPVLVPYRLPELRAAPPSMLVCVTEGEKDADTLAGLGFVATTQPLGAGKWESALSEHFRGRERVVVFEDNDDAGRQNTQVVAKALQGVVPAIAAAVAFPELPAHGDVSDWVAGLTAANVAPEAIARLLRARIDEAFKSTVAAPTQAEPLLWHGEPDPRPRMKWRIKHLMPAVGTGLLAGQWGTYKTFTAINLVTHIIAAGTTFCGRDVVEQCGVLILATEGGFDLRDRIDAAVTARWPGMVNAPITWREACPTLLVNDAVEQLNQVVQEASAGCQERFGLPIGLVIIDVLTDAAGYGKAGDENDPAIGAKLMGVLRRVADANTCFVLAIDHFGKTIEAGTRGSSAKEGAADLVLACLGEREVAGSVANPRLALRKVRGGPQGQEFPYRPRVVPISRPADDKPDESESTTTLVIEWEGSGLVRTTVDDPWEAVIQQTRRDDTKQALRIFYRALAKALTAHGVDMVSKTDGVVYRMVDQEHAWKEFEDLAVADGDAKQKRDAKLARFRRTLERAAEHELVGRQDIDDTTYLWAQGL